MVKTVTRRSFILGSILCATTLLAKDDGSRSLWLTHRDEEKSIIYHTNGDYIIDGYYQVSHFMRDRNEDAMTWIDYRLLDVLYSVQKHYQRPIEIKSGYRTPITNSKTLHSSKTSLHQYGKACDIAIDGIDNYELGIIARSYGANGVGIYKNYIHLDTGNVRHWFG